MVFCRQQAFGDHAYLMNDLNTLLSIGVKIPADYSTLSSEIPMGTDYE